MIRKLLHALIPYLPHARIIRDPVTREPYLSRWYLIGKDPTIDSTGQRAAGEDNSWTLLLHRFHRSDPDLELHNHPWAWSVALILAGGYREERRVADGLEEPTVEIRVVRPGSINWIWANTFHRVDLLDDDSWSLFLTGPTVQSWGFWERNSGLFTPWRQHIDAKIARARAEETRLQEAIGAWRHRFAGRWGRKAS